MALPPPLVGEALAKDSFFAIIAYGSKVIFCRRTKSNISRAKRSEAYTLESATACEGLPYGELASEGD